MKRFRKEYIIIAIAVLMSVAVLAGTTYAVFTKTVTGDEKLTIQTGTLEITFGEGNEINLSNTAPMSDERGQKTTPYTFSVKNTGTITAYYTVYIEEDSGNTLDNQYVKYRLISDDGFDTGIVNLAGSSGDYVIRTEEALAVDKTVNYTLYMWLDEATPNEMQGTIYKSRVRVDGRSNPSPSAINTLLAKANSSSVTNYSSGNTGEMYTFTHEAGDQQSGWTTTELTDYRYIGANPNNYVTFNDETWRIVGIFTVENSSGQRAQRLKIVRSTETSTCSADTGNNWTSNNLNTCLNTTFYNSLTSEAQNMIDNVKWFLGGFSSTSNNPPSWYQLERGSSYYSGNSINWIGKVALLYPSDYGYTFAYGVDTTCYNGNGCAGWTGGAPSSSWIYTDISLSHGIGLLTPSSSNTYVSYIHYGGQVMSTTNWSLIHPTVYLKTSVNISSGSGTSEDPYILSMDSGPVCDPNGDGVVTQEDVTILSNANLSGSTSSYYPQCDLNGDGEINMLDIMELGNQISS